MPAPSAGILSALGLPRRARSKVSRRISSSGIAITKPKPADGATGGPMVGPLDVTGRLDGRQSGGDVTIISTPASKASSASATRDGTSHPATSAVLAPTPTATPSANTTTTPATAPATAPKATPTATATNRRLFHNFPTPTSSQSSSPSEDSTPPLLTASPAPTTSSSSSTVSVADALISSPATSISASVSSSTPVSTPISTPVSPSPLRTRNLSPPSSSAFVHLRRRSRMNDSGVELPRGSARSSMDRSYASIDSGTSSADWPVHPFELNAIAELDSLPLGSEVNIRARISTHRQLSKALDFILLRDQTQSVQAVLSHDEVDMASWVQKLPPESLVQVSGILKEPPEPVRSATVDTVEVLIQSVHLVNTAHNAPFTNYKPPETLRNRMSSRILDLRHPSNQALFRIRSLVTRKFHDVLFDHGFVEINTPKLQPAATESGAAVFKVNYFSRNAFLAQSPQLAKQMSISADFGRVFEVGPVFRAENSNTHRHLTEYTGLDLEMAIEHDYHEVIEVIDEFLKSVFKAVYEMPEIAEVRSRWPSQDLKYLDKTLVLDFIEGVQMLRDDGRDVAEDEDLSTPDEIRLGQLVRDKYDTDYYVLDKFPTSARPFYTHKDPENPKWTRSFDIFIRGQEICSGGQRIHDVVELRANMRAAGIAEDGMDDYLDAFDLGAPPHAGAGLGLERIVAWLLELGDVRYASLFHRDPKSLPERTPGLAHPEADTTKPQPESILPPVEKLIANYGDASNTSWLDERFTIWRHPSGAAIGYVRQDKFAMITGDPLCDASQYKEVCMAFVKYISTELRLIPVWMLVSFEVQKILAKQMGWRTLSCTEEQRVNTDKRFSSIDGAKLRRVEREGVKIHEVKADEDFIKRTEQGIQSWKTSRKGRQVHMTEVRPWIDTEHRRYFAAEKDGKVHALVVLAKLSPKHGWQVKWALDFPGSVNGAIEVLIDYTLSAVHGPVTFGVGVSEKLTPGEHLHGIRARFLATTYNSIVESLGLRRKAGFRNKFGALGEEVYICYPKHGVGLRDLGQIVKFFQD
ncbi:hypothetical protein CDD80_6628 [Ophiocordyceps camponoti-rufipedis]|uniref:Probable aspartate--tRNA ligase, cytoplasmic n=1 Tax=Ophiocordyceps camponoti-rufipedis TaxID=2004952 RepID=A0A2C5ZEY8_9HYPO|nr:hypothetical protein CDD80_6628 [Ophiocordyceps camponoti-rufipedis]